jgi:hypothetical protein
MCFAGDVFQLPNSHDLELIFDNLVEIRKQSATETAEVPKPEPKDRTVTVSRLTEGTGFIEDGIKVLGAVFVYLRRLDYVAGLGSTGHVTSPGGGGDDCTMKIFTSLNFGFPVAFHLATLTGAMSAFNLQIRRQDANLRFCSMKNTHRERFEYEDYFI